jgi:predicted ribosomally synthesized peptide with nif11-like leader
MANLSAQEFIQKLATDASFRSQVGVSHNMQLDDFQAKAAAAGYNYTPEEILAAAEAQHGGALSDEALSNVSGGLAASRIKITITIEF